MTKVNSLYKQEKLLSLIKKQHKVSEINFISQNCIKPRLKLSRNELEYTRNNNENIIVLFKELVEDLLPLLHIEDIILITDSQLVLMDYYYTGNLKKNIIFDTGVVFSPDSLGTNALSLARELKEPVYLEPENHYILFFKKWFSLAVPLVVDDNILAVLGIFVKSINKEMFVLLKLCAELICSKLKLCNHYSDVEIQLTDNQKVILEYLIMGFKEQAIAQKLNFSIHNIKYHKRNIFRKMGVNSTRKLIYKALKSGIIDIDEIDKKFDISS